MTDPKRVLFLCTGNYYRSRFAEVLFNAKAQAAGIPWRADSRGLRLTNENVGPISFYTRDRLTAMNICCPTLGRMPAQVDERDLAGADHIVAVKEAEHRPLLSERYPHWLHRVEFWDVHDIDCAAPDAALPELERRVLSLLDRLAALAPA